MTSTPQKAAATHRARALKLERAGDLAAALGEYEAALALNPNDADLLAGLARLAGRMAMHDVAAKIWGRVAELEPHRVEAIDGRARALRELGFFSDAVALLQQALLAGPEEPRLWNSLGVTLTQQGQAELALTFFDEALRLDPGYGVALYNRGGASFDLGRLDDAQADFTRARALVENRADAATIDFAAVTLALSRGDLAAGWDGYDVRLSRDWAGSVTFEARGQRWTPEARLGGRRLLVLAEQGLGDEIMFANLLPDLLAELGPGGRLSLAVEPRLVQLFRRSFPQAEVTAHATRREGVRRVRSAPEVREAPELWAPLASLCRRFRRSIEDFPSEAGYLRPDPARVEHWRNWLDGGPPAVGLTWRSGKLEGDRRRHYPPLPVWAPVMRTPGVRFVNLQYGDCAEELPALAQLAGAPILQPPGLDLREDLDDLAALTAALDLVVAVSNATGALAGACGARTLLIGAPAAWPRLGAEGYPWYPSARAIAPPAVGEWAHVMAETAGVVAELAAQRSSAAA
jgi:tetratricopeptide (TPR) repeat protein